MNNQENFGVVCLSNLVIGGDGWFVVLFLDLSQKEAIGQVNYT